MRFVDRVLVVVDAGVMWFLVCRSSGAGEYPMSWKAMIS